MIFVLRTNCLRKKAKPDLETRTMCMNQLIRPRRHLPSPGRGNCSVCSYDPANNRYCIGYRPVRVYAFDVKNSGN